MDPFVIRGVERLMIVAGAVFFGYLGYRLFVKGLTAGEGNIEFESKAMKVIFSGTGPGLFFMAFGAIVLVVSTTIGGVTTKEVAQYGPTVPAALTEANKEIAELREANSSMLRTIREMQERPVSIQRDEEGKENTAPFSGTPEKK